MNDLETAADMLDERDRLRDALTIARIYVSAEVSYLRFKFRGFKECSRVVQAEADLARIDAALAIGEGNE